MAHLCVLQEQPISSSRLAALIHICVQMDIQTEANSTFLFMLRCAKKAFIPRKTS